MYIVSKVSPWKIWPRQERKNRNCTAEKPGRPRLSQAARLMPTAEGHVDITRLRKELRDASAVFPTQTHPLNLNPHVRNIQTQVKDYATQWAVLFKRVKVKKNEAIPRNCHRLEKKKETYEWNEMWDPAADPGLTTDISRKLARFQYVCRSANGITPMLISSLWYMRCFDGCCSLWGKPGEGFGENVPVLQLSVHPKLFPSKQQCVFPSRKQLDLTSYRVWVPTKMHF